MSACIVSLIHYRAEIVAEIHVIGLSDIEVMIDMPGIVRIEWLQDIDEILLGFDDDAVLIVRDIDILIEFQFQCQSLIDLIGCEIYRFVSSIEMVGIRHLGTDQIPGLAIFAFHLELAGLHDIVELLTCYHLSLRPEIEPEERTSCFQLYIGQSSVEHSDRKLCRSFLIQFLDAIGSEIAE